MSIKITHGDVTQPIGDGVKIIVHCVNSIGVMGSGVALAISRKWEHTREKYLEWFKTDRVELGDILFAKAEDNIFVCHLVGQKGVGGEEIDGKFIPPVRYESLREGMYRLRQAIIKYKERTSLTNVSIHSPLLGCELAGGRLEEVYPIVDEVFRESEIEFTFYAFSNEHFEKLQEIHNGVALDIS